MVTHSNQTVRKKALHRC